MKFHIAIYDMEIYLLSKFLFLREYTRSVLTELRTWVNVTGFPAHFPVEIRFVKSDDLMLSPASGRESTYINILMYKYVEVSFNQILFLVKYYLPKNFIFLKSEGIVS